EEKKLIKRVQTLENQARFEAQMTQHHHLICDKCKQIIDFQWKGFDDAGLPEEVAQIGHIRNKNVILLGTCRRCLEKEKK
ncbi:MAG: transcriptional repressor, partial [Thermodesulfobacteriota bacterium]|nr:transcriptional repressor [Thermodesulfobacteriota bacterium]